MRAEDRLPVEPSQIAARTGGGRRRQGVGTLGLPLSAGGRSPRACPSPSFLCSIRSALPARLEDPCPVPALSHVGELRGSGGVWVHLGSASVRSSFPLKVLFVYLLESEPREHKQGRAEGEAGSPGAGAQCAAESQDPKTRTWTEGRRFAQRAPRVPPPFSALAAARLPPGTQKPRASLFASCLGQLPRDFVQGTVPAGGLPGGHPRRLRLQDRARSGTVLGPLGLVGVQVDASLLAGPACC